MKTFLQLTTLALLALALNSCGIPGALVRTANNTAHSVGNLASSALGTGQ